MVVIDVFAKVRGAAAPGLSAYDADYAAMGHAKRLADSFGVAVVLVHHVRKMGSDDFLAEVSGTNGLAGAADATLVLKRARGNADGVLHVTGRDVDEAEYALTFQPACGAWHLLDGPPQEHALADTRAAILRHVRANPGDTPKAITEGTGLAYDNVKRTCQRMAADGQLIAAPGGRYRLPATPQDVEAVPGVPGVPDPHPTSENTLPFGGQPGGGAVPGVPRPVPANEERPVMTLTAPEPVQLADIVLYRVEDAMRVLGLGRTALYEQIRSGRLWSVKQGRTRLIPATAIHDYVALLEREAGGNR